MKKFKATKLQIDLECQIVATSNKEITLMDKINLSDYISDLKFGSNIVIIPF